MQSVEDSRPCPGLSVPVVTIVDDEGGLVEDDQRALVRYVIQEGRGADMIFAAGTTGEWDHLPTQTNRDAVRLCADETARQNQALGEKLTRPVECWAGITAHTASETLESLEHAIDCGVDAAVLAPLSIQGLDDPVRFVARDISDLLDDAPRRIPLYLYDNADIAVDPKLPHIRTRQVKALSRLDFVRGIKVSASRKVLGNYTKAAAGFRERGDFGIYVGNASLIFQLFRPRTGLTGVVAEHWNRYWLSGSLPVGVVSGPANAMPREWARAWQVCRAGDADRMDEVQVVVDAFREGTFAAGGRRTIACLKRALRGLGVVRHAGVASGTPELTRPDAERFDQVFARVRALSDEKLGAPWVSVVTEKPPAPKAHP